MAGYDGRGARFNIVAVEGNDLSFTVTAVTAITDEAPVALPVDLSAATITGTVYNGTGTAIDTLTDAVSGAGSNVITLSFTDAEVDALVDPKSWALVVERGGDARTWLAGSFTVSSADRARGGTSGTALTATVDSDVSVTVSIAAVGASLYDDIVALPTDTAPASTDLIPFVDVDAARTESVTVANLAASAAFSGQYVSFVSATATQSEIQAAIDAASALYASTGVRQTVLFPAAEYDVSFGLTPAKPTGYAVNITGAIEIGAGVTLRGVKGYTRFKSTAIATTTLNGGITLPQATITVASTAGFTSSGQFQIAGTTDVVTYTGITATTFTGCTGGTATLADGVAVVQRAYNAVFVTDFANEVNDWGLVDIVIDGQASAAVEILHEAVAVGPSKNWTIDGVEILDMYGKGVHVIGEVGGSARIPENWRVKNCYVHDISGNCVGYSQAGATNFWITDNTFVDSRIAGAEAIISSSLAGTAINRGRITGNDVVDFGDISASGTDMVVSGNYIKLPACGSPGILLGGANSSRVVISNNIIDTSVTLTSNNQGVRVTAPSAAHVTISDNVIKGNTAGTDSAGVAVQPSSGQCSNLAIVGNVFPTRATGVDIYLTNLIDSTVSGNSCGSPQSIQTQSSCTRLAISANRGSYFVLNSTDCTVSGNTVTSPSTNVGGIRGIGDRMLITGNHVYQASTNSSPAAISATGADCRITGNLISNVNSGQVWIATTGARTVVTENTLVGTSGTLSVTGTGAIARNNAGYPDTVNAQTGTSYTLAAKDAGALVTLSNASAITVSVPQDSDATIAVGTYVDLYQLGAGQVTVQADTGATLRVSGLTAKARAQYSRLGVQKVSANTWSLFGDLAAS